MSQKIKISADVTGFKKDIMSLSKDLDKMSGKKKLQIFDKETRDFISKGMNNAISQMTKGMDKLKQKNDDILDSLKNQNLTSAQINKKQYEAIRNAKQILDLEKGIKETREASSSVLGQTSRGGQFVSGFKKTPGFGRIGKMFEGGIEGLGSLAGGGLLGLGAFAGGRALNGFNTFDQNKDSMISMMGRGMGPGIGGNAESRKLGLNAESLRQLQLQSVDIFGRSGSGAGAINKVQKTALSTGLDASQLMGSGEGLRATMGISQGQKAFAKLLANLTATDVDGAVGPYLETTAKMLTDINENGIGLDSAALAVMSTFASKAGGLSPEQTQKVFMGIDSAVKGATGERAAFFMSALSSKGIGGGSIGGAQIAMKQGLFGGNADKLGAGGYVEKAFPGLIKDFVGKGILFNDKNGTGGFQKRAQGITDQFNSMTKNSSNEGKAQQAGMILGIQDPVSAIRAMSLLSKAASGVGLSKKEKGELSDLSKDNLTKIQESSAQLLKSSQALKADMSESLGEGLVPLAVEANEFLANIDAGITYMAKKLGFSGRESVMPTTEEGLKSAIKSESKRAQLYGGLGSPVEAQMLEHIKKMSEALGKMHAHTLKIANKTEKPKNTQKQGSAKTLHSGGH